MDDAHPARAGDCAGFA